MISLIDFGFKPCQKISALHGLYNQSARGIKQSTWNIFCSAFTFNSLGIHININKLVSFTDTPIRFYHVLRLDNVFKWGKYISFFLWQTKVYHSPRCTSLFLLPRFRGVLVSICVLNILSASVLHVCSPLKLAHTHLFGSSSFWPGLRAFMPWNNCCFYIKYF